MWVSKSLSIGSTPPGIRSIRENIRLSSEGREGGRKGERKGGREGRKKVVKIEMILAKGRGSRREGGREREGEWEGGRGRARERGGRGREERVSDTLSISLLAISFRHSATIVGAWSLTSTCTTVSISCNRK